MRILSISNTPHDPSQGSGYVITGYVEGLRDRGHEVRACGPDDWCWIDVHRGRRYAYSIMIAIFGLWYCRPRTYDLTELWGGHTWLLAICLRWLIPDGTLVHHSNGIEQHRIEVQRESPVGDIQNTRWFQWDASRLYDWGLQAADAIVTVSSYDVPYLKSRSYVPDDRVYAISNPLPDTFLGQQVDYDRPRRIGFCGTWIARKGTHLLEADLPPFLREHPEWTFSVVGVGDSDVRTRFPSDVQEQVEVIPYLERSELLDWYHSLALFTLPSIYESFGLVMAEAMACGAALVATDVGFAHTLEHNTEAMIIEPPSSPRLYEVLTTLAEENRLRRRIAKKGYNRVQGLRWNDAVSKIEVIYGKISKV